MAFDFNAWKAKFKELLKELPDWIPSVNAHKVSLTIGEDQWAVHGEIRDLMEECDICGEACIEREDNANDQD